MNNFWIDDSRLCNFSKQLYRCPTKKSTNGGIKNQVHLPTGQAPGRESTENSSGLKPSYGAAGMFNDTEARFKPGSHSGNSPVPVSDKPVNSDTFTVLPSLAVTPVAGRRFR